MRFTDWWRLRYGESSRPDSTYLERDLKQWACLAWIQGFEEGRKRALEERSDTSQGGGSQVVQPEAPRCAFPCHGYEPCKCRAGGA